VRVHSPRSIGAAKKATTTVFIMAFLKSFFVPSLSELTQRTSFLTKKVALLMSNCNLCHFLKLMDGKKEDPSSYISFLVYHCGVIRPHGLV